jgi:hypothetical protein
MKAARRPKSAGSTDDMLALALLRHQPAIGRRCTSSSPISRLLCNGSRHHVPSPSAPPLLLFHRRTSHGNATTPSAVTLLLHAHFLACAMNFRVADCSTISSETQCLARSDVTSSSRQWSTSAQSNYDTQNHHCGNRLRHRRCHSRGTTILRASSQHITRHDTSRQKR